MLPIYAKGSHGYTPPGDSLHSWEQCITRTKQNNLIIKQNKDRDKKNLTPTSKIKAEFIHLQDQINYPGYQCDS